MKCYVLILLLAFGVWPQAVWALSGEWQHTDEVAVRLVSGVEAVGELPVVPLGLEVRLAPEWHTYWRSPGMAGLPPQIDWQESTTDEGNLKGAELLYPAPRRYVSYGLETVGYRDHVLFPIDAVLKHQGQPLVLKASLDLLVCSATCVPQTFPLILTVPTGEATLSPEASSIDASRSLIPKREAASGISIKNVSSDGNQITLTLEGRDPFQDPDVFVEGPSNLSFGAPSIVFKPSHKEVDLTIKPSDPLEKGRSLRGMEFTVTIVDQAHSLEQKIEIPVVDNKGSSSQPGHLTLWIAFACSLLGGFILNLMPCVLPVLSLKVLSAIGHGGGEAKLVRRSFFMTAAGILFSFMVLAGVTITLKEAGYSFGWGVQFQQPLFLVGLVFLLTCFSANMWGLVDLQLPQWLADGLGQAVYHPKLAGDFATGAFATLLATPCSAPFLGTAIGFALSSGPLTILFVFLGLGFGMATPYIAVALFPWLAIALPKPGIWMVKLRYLLGTALGVTAIWLLWVLSSQITPLYATAVGLFMGLILVLWGCAKRCLLTPWKIKGGLFLVLCGILVLTLMGTAMPRPKSAPDKLWTVFSEEEVSTKVRQGKVVFVDVTADWCLTCKVNQRLVLSEKDIQDKLFKSSVVAMQADWTNPDPKIADFLHKHQRYGIPFNIVYGPGAPDGISLPELLTHQSVVEALKKAAGS